MFAGSEINFFMRAPSGDYTIFFFFGHQMEKSGYQKVFINVFFDSEIQKHEVF